MTTPRSFFFSDGLYFAGSLGHIHLCPSWSSSILLIWGLGPLAYLLFGGPVTLPFLALASVLGVHNGWTPFCTELAHFLGHLVGIRLFTWFPFFVDRVFQSPVLQRRLRI